MVSRVKLTRCAYDYRHSSRRKAREDRKPGYVHLQQHVIVQYAVAFASAPSLSGPKPFVVLRGNEGKNAGIRTVGLQDTEDLVTYWKYN